MHGKLVRKKVKIEGLEDKLNDARNKNKALEQKVGKMDAEIYEMKIDLQSMVDRLRVKECHLFSWRQRYPVFQYLYRRKVCGATPTVGQGK